MLQRFIKLVWTGKPFGVSFACLGLRPFSAYWALEGAKGPDLSYVLSESRRHTTCTGPKKVELKRKKKLKNGRFFNHEFRDRLALI